MSFDVIQRAEVNRRRRFWLLVAGALAAALAVTSALAFLHGGKEQSPRAPTKPAVTRGTPAVAVSPLQSVASPGAAEQAGAAPSAWVPPARQVVLPEGKDQIEEFPVGFPRTPEGAAAAEVTKDRYGTTLDYQLANTVARIYLAPTLTAMADQASTATVQALRTKLGVNVSGPAPIGTSAVSRPLGVQWTKTADGRVEVSVLTQVDYRMPGKAWSELAAATTVWQWMQGAAGRPADWRLVDGRRPDAALAPIGSKGFNDAGWIAIVTETAR